MKSCSSNDKPYEADSIESAVHGLVEEFFEMLGQGEAGSSTFSGIAQKKYLLYGLMWGLVTCNPPCTAGSNATDPIPFMLSPQRYIGIPFFDH